MPVSKGGEIKMTITIIGGLKGPWTVVPEGDGHGYLGAIQYDDVKDKIQCHACGKWFKMINGRHLSSANCSGLVSNSREYKWKYGFPQAKGMNAPTTREKRILDAKRKITQGKLLPFGAQNPEHSRAARKLATATRKRQSMHQRNKKQICPAQLKSALLKISTILGRLPGLWELPPEIRNPLLYQYDTYNNALTVLGIESRKYGQGQVARPGFGYANEELLQLLRNFKERYNRSPVVSDTTAGLLPATTTYANHFGAWSNAKKLAGV